MNEPETLFELTKPLNSSALRIFLIMAGLDRFRGLNQYGSNENLVELSGYGLTTVHKSLRTLERAGLVTRVVQRDESGCRRTFTIHNLSSNC